MYADDQSGIKIPVLIEKASPIEEARHKFAIFDLSGCANTLRSICESELKRILPLKYVLQKQDDPNSTVQINTLAALINKLNPFRTRFFTNSLEQFPNIAPNLSQHRQLIMNPYSHDDIETPLYRSELKTAIDEVEELTRIEKRQVLTDEIDINNRLFQISISDGASTIAAVFFFTERFECVTYAGKKYYSDSMIHINSCSEPAISINGKQTIRRLYKSIYELLGLTADTRPAFDSCVFDATTGSPLSTL